MACVLLAVRAHHVVVASDDQGLYPSSLQPLEVLCQTLMAVALAVEGEVTTDEQQLWLGVDDFAGHALDDEVAAEH